MEYKNITSMENIEKLRTLMTIGDNPLDFDERFREIAKLLFGSFAIKKGEEYYLFKEIEFYYYNNAHRDIITHPRNSEALCWYVNDFGGIDLNFESCIKKETRETNKKKKEKYILTADSYFGGILIRQLQYEGTDKILEGPWACSELFRTIKSTGNDTEFPVLVEHDSKGTFDKQSKRMNLLRSKQTIPQKVNYILSESYHEHPDKDGLYTDFDSYKEKLYRYLSSVKQM